jgi:hypothetical protein
MRIVTLVLWIGLAAPALAADEPVPLPRPGELNRYVVEVLQSFPTDGTHRYNWKKGPAYAGVTEDLVYQGEVVARSNGQGEAYCCGLTFEVFFKAYQRWAAKRKLPFRIGSLTPAELRKLRRDWYCVKGRQGPVDALVPRSLGRRIERLRDARPGDFVQYWRQKGGGHSVIFIGWEKDQHGRVTGLRYWSTQPATNGIGYCVARFDGKDPVDPEQIYLARVGADRP